MADTIRTLKITNALYAGVVGPQIKAYFEKTKRENVTYETLYSYFTNIIQHGGDNHEFWVVFDGEEPMGFMSWVLRSLPYVGTVFVEHVYVWGKEKVYFERLLLEMEAFAKRKRAPYIMGDLYNAAVWRLVSNAVGKFGYTLQETGHRQFITRKANE